MWHVTVNINTILRKVSFYQAICSMCTCRRRDAEVKM